MEYLPFVMGISQAALICMFDPTYQCPEQPAQVHWKDPAKDYRYPCFHNSTKPSECAKCSILTSLRHWRSKGQEGKIKLLQISCWLDGLIGVQPARFYTIEIWGARTKFPMCINLVIPLTQYV